MSSKFWKLSADRMPTTPDEVAECMHSWYGHERWGRPTMQWTAERFLREYYAAVEVLGQDPMTAYATASRAIFPEEPTP